MKGYLGRVLVTGGSGFIGSHLVDALMSHGNEVVVLDNLSSGSLRNVARWLDSSNFRFIKGDLLNLQEISEALDGCEIVFHLAANPEVRVSSVTPDVHFQQNIVTTFNLLEALRRSGATKILAFASSSAVYGEAKTPTPEDYPFPMPISVYGASKFACEALISAYAHTYGFRAIIYRLANVVGPRSKHGVIADFIRKLGENPGELEILGDGLQRKSYIYVGDCVEALLFGLDAAHGQVEVFNVGSEDQIDVLTVAKIVTEEMGLNSVRFKLTGGVNGGRGWVGDVRNMLLDVSKLKERGWKPKHNSAASVRLAVREMLYEGAHTEGTARIGR